MEEAKRQSYLKAMGVTQWQLRSAEAESAVVAPTEEIIIEEQFNESASSVSQVDVQVDVPVPAKQFTVKGLKWLNKGSKNGLLVVLPDQRKDLAPESRMLMSKMLKGIHFLPSETGFAVIGEDTSPAAEPFTLESIKAILVLGNEAGRQLVKIAGARIIPGSEVFTLDGRKIVISWHPDELLNNVEYKQQAWNDLKQLVQFFNNN